MSFTVHPHLPSILGDRSEVPLSPISLAQMATIPSVHVFPERLDLDRLTEALEELTRLYPVICGRLGRREVKREAGGPYDYFVSLTNSALQVELLPAPDPSLPQPFATPAVLQPTLDPYLPPLNSSAQLNNPLEPLFSIRITRFDTYDVLGLNWAHVLGDGAACNRFEGVLSRLYAGETIPEEERPNFEPHVDLILQPSEEMMSKWESPIMYPFYDLPQLGEIYGKAHSESELVQFNLLPAEVKLLQSLAKGEGEEGWVSEQDGISSYFVGLLELAGEEINSICNSVNYRTFYPNHPAYPPTLPLLVANVAQMFHTPLPPRPASLSLKAYALALRQSLTLLRSSPDQALEWLSVRASRMREACDAQHGQSYVPSPGEAIINSNWRYEWNHRFGFGEGETSYHGAFAIVNFLRVFRSNTGGEAECTFRVARGRAEVVLGELERDRREGWARWK